MPWQPLPHIAFAVATYPFAASQPEDLFLEIGDELYIIEETPDGNWLRGYLLKPPSLLAGLTSVKGQTLEARVYSGIFPRSCVEVREVLGESEAADDNESEDGTDAAGEAVQNGGDSAKSGLGNKKRKTTGKGLEVPISKLEKGKKVARDMPLPPEGRLSVPVKRDPDAPRPQAPVPMLKIGDETPTSAAEPLIDEISSCLRELHSTNLHGLLLSRQYHKLDQLSHLLSTLNLSRQQFLHNVLTTWEYNNLREKTVWDLVKVNKLCGGEVIVRDPQERGRILTGDDSVVEITKLQSVMSLLDEAPQPTVELTALHHLLVDIRGIAGASNESLTVVMYLANKSSSGATTISESYAIEIPPGGTMTSFARNTQMRTLFADLSASDIGDAPAADSELLLIVKVRSSQQIAGLKPSSRSGTTSHGTAYSRESGKPPLASGNKSVRRSLMWAGKSTRTAFSRGNPKLDSLNEGEERPGTGGEGWDMHPPSTANSKASKGQRASMDGTVHMTVERTIGMGVLKLNAVMKQEEEVEHVIGIWSPADRFVAEKQGGDEWDPVITELMESKSGQYERARGAERMQIHMKAFNNPDADALIKATPTLLSGVCKTNKMGFSGAPTKPRSDIFVTIDEAALSRHTLLSRYTGSAAALPTNLHGGSLQVSMEVRRTSGERIDNCIFPSSNSEGLSTWKTVAAGRGEAWQQTVRLALAPQDVFAAHIALFVSDMPNPPFAVAYMPLWDEAAFVRDGPHALLLYKVDEHTVAPQPTAQGRGGYLSLPWNRRVTGLTQTQSEVTGPLATLRVDSYLCSTRFSQDRTVLGLVKWKEGSRDDIPDLLKQLIFAPEIEVVKLLSDVLDALFAILVEYSGNDEYEDLVFTALVRVLGIVHDRRFNLGPLVDHYAENKFNYPFATPCLVRSFTRLLEKPSEPEISRKLRATFKVVRHILKFITHARGQQKVKEAGIGITSSSPGFTRHLRSIFKALDAMMRNTAPVLVGNQTLAVQHFHTWLPELAGLLTTEEILHIAIDFVDSCESVRGKLVLYKLVLIINYSKLAVFSHPEQRSVLSANTVRWIAPHWGSPDEVTEQWKEQVRLCCSVLASQVDHLGAEIPDYIPKILESYLAIQAVTPKPRTRLSLLFPSQYPFPSKPMPDELTFDEALVELSAVLSALSNSPSGMQLELADDDLGLILENALQVHMSILQGDAYPTNWLSVHIYHHKSIMRTLQYIATILLESFLPHPDEAENFNTELWKMFFTTLLKLVGTSSLALETFPEQKRRAVWKIAGDVREHGADLLRRTWEAIGWDTSQEERKRYGLSKMGGYQVQYVPTLVSPIVELCLSVHEGLRRMAVEVLQTMIVSEWTLSEDLSVIQTEIIDCLDEYFKSKPLTESILQKLFVREILERFAPLAEIENEPLYLALHELMETVDEFLDLLVAVHSGDGSGGAAHLINRLRLMEFLRDMQKEEIFVRYVHQLADLQAEARNHAEAGLALRLHAELYDWDPLKTTPALTDPEFPPQTHFERKERIYFDMIKHFEEGEAWGSALAAYKELQVQYETNIFDFAKLARTERAIATIYETIAKSEKLVPKYFKVIFKGLGFPVSLRDKEFVYEGSPTEKASAFTDRMQEQFPSAQIVTSDNMGDVEGQFLVISAISPHRDLSHQVFQRARVPHVIRDYLVSAHPQSFSVSSKRNTTGPASEHYAEKVVYTTADAFPTILRRSEIIATEEVRLSAKETGLERIVRKTGEMTGVERKIAEGDSSPELAQLLVDAISVSVNPNSENSVGCYRDLLPVASQAEEDEEPPEPVELDAQENAIKMALVDHAMMIKRCLAMFAKSSSEVLRKHHADLQTFFEVTFASEIAIFTPAASTSRDTTTPSPTWPRSSPTDTTPPHLRHPSLTKPLANGTPTNTTTTTNPPDAETAAQPALRQRGARLSFLGGRRKDPTPPPPPPPQKDPAPAPHTNGDHAELDAARERERESASRSRSKDANRRSFFRSHSPEKPPLPPAPAHGYPAGANGGGYAAGPQQQQQQQVEWEGRSLGEREAAAAAAAAAGSEKSSSAGGSVRKRLSLLKLGRKASRGNGLMGAVDEE